MAAEIHPPQYYLTQLQALPDRGTATINEKKSAGLLLKLLRAIGLNPNVQKIQVLRNGVWFHFITTLLFTLSVLLGMLRYYLPAWILFLVAVWLRYEIPVSIISLLQGLLPASSQNVYTSINPTIETQKTIVLVSHYDTAQAVWGMNIIGKPLSNLFGLRPPRNEVPHFTFRIADVFKGPFWLINICVIITLLWLLFPALPPLPLLVIFALSAFIAWKSSQNPYVPGAFDNGSGVAMLLSLAEYFKQHPPHNTQLVFLFTGSEENITKGISNFLTEQKLDKENTHFLNIDAVGAEQLLAVYGEINYRGLPIYYNPGLFMQLQEVLTAQIHLKEIKSWFLPAGTDAGRIAAAGYKVIATLTSLNNAGRVDHYHQMTDTLDKVNESTVNLCQEVIIRLIHRFDRSTTARSEVS